METDEELLESLEGDIVSVIYTNDENGRPISAELIETKNGKNDYASQTLTFNYKTRYSYQAE